MTFCYLSRLNAHLNSFCSIEVVPYHRTIKVHSSSTIEQLALQIEAEFHGSVCVAFLLDHEDEVILRWHERVEEVLPSRTARVRVIDLLNSTPLKRNIHISPSSPHPSLLHSSPSAPFPSSKSNLDLICLNSLSLTSFAKFALRKNFLEELLFYLDCYYSKCQRGYIVSVYLHANSPLRLPILTPEVNTIEGAFEVVECGLLNRWAVAAWEESEEGKLFWRLKTSRTFSPPDSVDPDLCASTTLVTPISKDLTSLLGKTLLSHHKVDFEAREKVLAVICREYFGDRISTSGYLLKSTLGLSKPDRIRKQILFDVLNQHSPCSSAKPTQISEELDILQDYNCDSCEDEEDLVFKDNDSEGSEIKALLQPKPRIADEASFVFQQNGLSPQTRREMRKKHGKLCKILGEPPPEEKIDVPRPARRLSVASFETTSSLDDTFEKAAGHSSKLKSAQKVYSLLGEHVLPPTTLHQVTPKARSRVESVKQAKKLCKVFGEPPPTEHFYVLHTPPDSPHITITEEEPGHVSKCNQRKRAEKLRNFFGMGVPIELERVGSSWL